MKKPNRLNKHSLKRPERTCPCCRNDMYIPKKIKIQKDILKSQEIV